MPIEMDNSAHDAFEDILKHLLSNSGHQPETGQAGRSGTDIQKKLAESNEPATVGLMWSSSTAIIKKIKSTNATLDARLTAIEQRHTMSFECAHDPSRTYTNGDVVQRSNALYVCMMDTTDTPGNSASWRRIGVSK